MTDMWLYLHDARTRDLEEEARLAMHRRAAAELRRRERERARRAAWAWVTSVLRGRDESPAACAAC